MSVCFPNKRADYAPALAEQRSLEKTLNALKWCLNEASDEHSDYLSWSKQDLLNIKEKINKLSFPVRTRKSGRLEREIRLIIENILNSKRVFPLSDDLIYKMAISFFDMGDLNVLARLNRHGRLCARYAVIGHARKWGYSGSSREDAKLFLSHLFSQIRSFCSTTSCPKNIFKKQNRNLYPEEALKNLQKLSTEEKLILLVDESFFSKKHSSLRLFVKHDPTLEKIWFEDIAHRLVVRSGDENLLKYCLEAIDYAGMRSHPLHFAAQLGALKSIKIIVNIDPSGINKQGLYGANALCFACGLCPLYPKSHKPEVVEFLLKSGENPNFQVDTAAGGRYPLHFAVAGNRVEIVRVLLAYGADPTLPDNRGITPKMLANELWRREIIDLLADY